MQSPIASKHGCSVLSITTKNFYYGTFFYYIPCRIWSTNIIKITEPSCKKKKYLSAFIENYFYNPAVLFIVHNGFYILTVYYRFFLVIYVRLLKSLVHIYGFFSSQKRQHSNPCLCHDKLTGWQKVDTCRLYTMGRRLINKWRCHCQMLFIWRKIQMG